MGPDTGWLYSAGGHLKDSTALISTPSSGSTRMRSLAYRMPTMLSLLSWYTGMRVNPGHQLC